MDGYIRVSRVMDREGETFISPDVQREKIQAWATMRAVQIGAWHTDLDESGGNLTRPGLDAMMARVRAGETGGVIVASLDRLSRANVADALKLVEEIHEAGGQLAAIDLGVDPKGEFGEFALTILLGLARMQRRRYASAWVTAVGRAVDRGVHPAPYGAYGYDRVNGRLLVNDAAPFVRGAFERRAVDRWAYERIAEHLNADAPPHIRTLKDGTEVARPWTAASVTRLLARRVYLGEAFSAVGTNGNPHRNRDAHEPIVSEGLFLAAQDARGVASPLIDDGHLFLLAGLVRCAGCRFVMSHANVKNRLAVGGMLPLHRCRGKRTSGSCQARAFVTAPRVEEYVENELCELLRTRVATADGAPDTRDLADAEQALEDARGDVEEMRQDTAARKRLGSRWLSFLEPLLVAEEEAARRLTTLAAGSAQSMRVITAAAYRASPRAERRLILADFIDAVMVRHDPGAPRGRNAQPLGPDRVQIIWRGDLPDGFPASGRVSEGGIAEWPWPEREASPGVLAA